MKKLIIKKYSILLVLLILVNIGISYYVPKTNAKYITNGSISYDTDFYSITDDFNVAYKTKEIENEKVYVTYKISFSRNPMIYSGETDTYNVYARVNDQVNTCTLTPEYTTSASDSGYVTKTLYYDSTLSNFNFTAKCDVTNVVDSADIHLYAEEVIGSQKYVLGDTYQTYSNVNLYDLIMNKLNTYDNELKTYLTTYFYHYVKSQADLYAGVEVPGLTYNVIEGTYTIDSNYIGYAITFVNNYNNSSTINFLSFSDTENIVSVFTHYLKTYLKYTDDEIYYISKYIVENSTYDNLKDALLNLPTTITTIKGITSAETPMVDGTYQINFYKEIVLNVVNLTYNRTNFFRLLSGGSTSTRTNYNNLIGYFNYPEVTAKTFIRTQFLNLEENESKVFIIDATKDDTPVKLLVNIYRGTVGSTDYNYLSIQELSGDQIVTIHNNTTLKYYDMVNDPTGSTVITADNYDETNTLEILNRVGKYVYGDTYEVSLETLKISEITNNISYTLTNN